MVEHGADVGHRHVAAENRLVADDDAHDVAILVRERDPDAHLFLGAIRVGADPDAERDVQVVLRGEARDFAERAAHLVAADRMGLAGEQRKVAIDVLDRGELVLHRILAGLEWREREALDDRWPRRFGLGLVDPGPDGHRGRGEHHGDQYASEETGGSGHARAGGIRAGASKYHARIALR